MPGPNGGAREGAGAKPKSERFAGPIAEAQEIIAASLADVARKQVETAKGESERVDVRRVMVGTLLRKDVVRHPDGTPFLDEKGKLTVIQVQIDLGPEFKPCDMVTVEERISHPPPDAQAGDRLLSRMMGTPAPEPESEAEGFDLRTALEEAEEIQAGYRDPDDDAPPDAQLDPL